MTDHQHHLMNWVISVKVYNFFFLILHVPFVVFLNLITRCHFPFLFFFFILFKSKYYTHIFIGCVPAFDQCTGLKNDSKLHHQTTVPAKGIAAPICAYNVCNMADLHTKYARTAGVFIL